MIDLHCHVLPGIDDGPRTLEGSVGLARAAAAAGTRTIVATPHVSWHYPNAAETIGELVDAVNRRFAAEGLAVDVRPGAEIALTRLGEIPDDELAKLRLGAGPWLLVEPPFTPVVSGIETILGELLRAGHGVVLAHPERCPAFHRDPRLLESLLGAGVLTSITAGSLVGAFGEAVRTFALELVGRGMVHNVASDAHDHLRRPPGVLREIERAGLAPLAAWLTQEVPEAILRGSETIPPRPEVEVTAPPPGKRPWWRRRDRPDLAEGA